MATIPYTISFIKNFLLTLNRTKLSGKINRLSQCLITPNCLFEYLKWVDFRKILFRKRSTKVCLNLSLEMLLWHWSYISRRKGPERTFQVLFHFTSFWLQSEFHIFVAKISLVCIFLCSIISAIHKNMVEVLKTVSFSLIHQNKMTFIKAAVSRRVCWVWICALSVPVLFKCNSFALPPLVCFLIVFSCVWVFKRAVWDFFLCQFVMLCIHVIGNYPDSEV